MKDEDIFDADKEPLIKDMEPCSNLNFASIPFFSGRGTNHAAGVNYCKRLRERYLGKR
jgi:hypothetical protein